MGMKLDAPVATNALDSSGEILSIKGLDITDFLEGRAVANWEHSNSSEDGAVGRFIYAKKIFSEADCENERQLAFWKQLRHEFLYGVVELFDDEDHPGATAIAAMVRYFLKRKEKIRIGMSIEGSTLERDGHLLNRAVARKAAITLTPCNKECWVEFFGQNDEMPVSKTESVEVVDFEPLIKVKQLELPFDSNDEISRGLKDGNVFVRQKAIQHPNATPEHISQALQDKDRLVRLTAVQHPNVTPEHISQALQDENADVRRDAIRHPKVTPEHISQALQDENADVRASAIEHPKATLEHISQALQDEDAYVRLRAIQHPNATPEHISQALQDKHADVRELAIKHPKATLEHISQALQDKDGYVRAVAKDLQKLHDPQDEKLQVRFGTAKMRQLRDVLDKYHGGKINAKELARKGMDVNQAGLAHLKDAQGNIDSRKVQEAIDKLPSKEYGYSWSTWDGAQTHSSAGQDVFQLNITKPMIDEMKAKGVYDMYREMVDLSYNSNHPVKKHGIGWVRYNRGSDGNIHIDEVQSDLGQSIVKQGKGKLKRALEEGEIDEQEYATKVQELEKKFPEEKFKIIKDILFGNKHPSEVLHEAFYEAMRHHPIGFDEKGNPKTHVGRKVSIWGKEPRARLSNMRLGEKLPGHIEEGYEDIPKKMGYTKGTYGQHNVSAQTNEDEWGGQPVWNNIVRKQEAVSAVQAFQKSLPHPHSYDWHDTPTLKKDDKANPFPHTESHGPIVNEQAGGVSDASFNGVMSNWGTVHGREKPSNLKFYQNLENYGPKVKNLLQQHGYNAYYAGGKYGKPDLANKNYHTKHLMIYDPTSGSGGDFGHEAYTDAWRKTHELAHALTHNDINSIYGEGRRMGKLGQRTPREMKRAVHWEWLAAHKQRDLMKQMGYHISDEDFHKELNTIMGDATHRALTGKFTDPHEMGFVPHSKKIPLEQSLNMIDAHAKKLGLKHDDDKLTLKQEILNELEEFKKTMTAGMGITAPSTLTNGGALARAKVELQKKLKEVFSKWDKKTPVKKVIKAAMPALSDKYVDHFADVAEDIAIKKGEIAVITSQNSNPIGMVQSDEQSSLIQGILVPLAEQWMNEKTGKFFNANGDTVRLSVNSDKTKGEFYFLISKYFGLGKYFNRVHNFEWNPNTTSMDYMKDGSDKIELLAEQILDNFKLPTEKEYQECITKLKSSGDIYKLAMAELILGSGPQRTKFSTLTNGEQVIFLEPSSLFGHDTVKIPTHSIEGDLLPFDVINWLNALDDNKLALYLSFMGVSRQQIHKCLETKSIILEHKNELIGTIYQKVAENNQILASVG